MTHLSPRVCLDLGELELGVVGVHLADLLPGRGAENLQRGGATGDTTELFPALPPTEGSLLQLVRGKRRDGLAAMNQTRDIPARALSVWFTVSNEDKNQTR